MAVHRISDAAEAALHRVAATEKTTKLGDILSKLIIDYERGLQFSDPNHPGPNLVDPDPYGALPHFDPKARG